MRKLKPAAAIQKATEIASVETASAELEITASAAEVEAALKPHGQAHIADTILRVDAERIDNVLNLVGELIIGKSMLQQGLNEFSRRFPKEGLRNRFADAMAFQARVFNDLQRSVMKIRMVPVEQLFRRFPRMVRDVAKQCGRQVELVMSGQDTDLDKSLLDSIAEPLTHLVRNAVSHGIESPEERTKNGKPAQGKLRLNAYHQGNQVIIEVTDDGRGIDAQKVKAKAVQQGLLSADEATHLSEAQVFDLVFRPGFSTADQITEVAGRGVGLDVVQSVLQRLKGSVEIETHAGQGTTFRLKLPLTLAIIKALLFRVEQRLYAIPLNAVAEITRAKESDLHQVERREVLQLRNRALPVVRLGRRPDDDNVARKIFVLVISFGERKLGMIVDALEGEEELVIKALDDRTVETDLVSGASILGDGRVVLILNLASVLERSNKRSHNNTCTPSSARTGRTRASARACCSKTRACAYGRSASPPASASPSTGTSWTTSGRASAAATAISRDGEGNTKGRATAPRDRGTQFAAGESMIHDLVNAGNADIVFTTVEFLHSANEPLPLAESPRA